MLIAHDELCTLIPHAGDMVLLDGVVSWDETTILCCATSHRDATNPLRSAAGLSVLQGIEYGAQAMAVHGGLSARARGEVMMGGYLAALRNVEFNVEWLHEIDAPLQVAAMQLLGESGHFMYEFSLMADDRLLLKGRATVMVQKRSAV
jgi:predicted hotdog family 3-hydroxylacyl-ACP dehydratase